LLFKSILGAFSRRETVASPAAAESADRRDDAGERRASIDRADALRDEGRFGPALATLRAAGGAGDASIDLAVMRLLGRWNRGREARAAAARIDLDDCDPKGLADVAMVLLHSDAAGKAREAAARAWRAAPDDPQVLCAYAAVQMSVGRAEDAIALYERLAADQPGSAAAWMLLAEAQLGVNDRAAARTSLGRVLALEPNHTRALEHLGLFELLDDRLDAAIATLERAEASDPGGAGGNAFVNLALCYCNVGRWEEAIDLLARELPSRPVSNGHMTLGLALLVQGRLSEGWRQYEFRWISDALASGRPPYDRPAWDGQPLEGKTILIVAEQGIGDILNLSRYFPLLRERGARVVVQARNHLGPLADRLPGVDVLLRDGDAIPEIDYFAFLMSLPRAFRTTLDTIPPPVGRLVPLPERTARWRARLGAADRPRIGVTWAGSPKHQNDRNRSLRLDALAPVLSVPGARFFGLQKGPPVAQAEIVPSSVDWTSLGPAFDDLEDAAAAIAELDLVICVDTGLAHLAALMDKPVWMLTATPPDFRWLLDGDDSPWYATIRLFRQPTRGDWATPISRVAEALRAWVDAWHAAADAGTRPPPPPAPRTPRIAPPERPMPRLSRVAATASGYVQYDPDAPFAGRSIELLGEWLPRRLGLALALCRPGDTVLEIGSGDGMHSIPIAKAIGDAGHLFSSEAAPSARRRLAQNFAANAITNATMLIRAISDVPAAGFDTVDELDLERVDGILVGEPGAADRVFRGASATLWRSRPWVLADADDERVASAIAATLRAHGYRLWMQEAPLYTTANFNRRERDPFDGLKRRTIVALPEERPMDLVAEGCREWH